MARTVTGELGAMLPPFGAVTVAVKLPSLSVTPVPMGLPFWSFKTTGVPSATGGPSSFNTLPPTSNWSRRPSPLGSKTRTLSMVGVALAP
ncbi:hypothetical protein GVX86_02530 [[Haemophilus] felis]|nr:hypothetical protein [[Haemophilus] felis]